MRHDALGTVLLVVMTLGLTVACAGPSKNDSEPPLPEGAEARSLLGKPLFAPTLPEAVLEDRNAKLAAALARYESEPDNLDALIWYGRRTAYLGRYRDAVAIYSGGLKLHPGSPELYRHRGHRYITLRKFDEAVWDLEQAARLIEGKADVVEQDGLPNARNQPTSTLHSNIWYHLGLAYFVQADYESAKRCYLECRKVSRNPDMLCATTHWLYMTLRRLGEDDEARATLEPIRAEMDVIENTAYHRLLLMYKGEIDPDRLLAEVRGDNGTIETASTGFGVANWLLVEGDRDSANALMEDLASGAQWAAFGSIAAEADVARRRATP